MSLASAFRASADLDKELPSYIAHRAGDLLQSLDPDLPISVQSWYEEMNGAMFAPRIATLALRIMGAILSIAGIFDMAAYSASKRMKELGILNSLGAQRKEVLHAAPECATKLFAASSSVGLVRALIVNEATPRDPFLLAGVLLAMALLGLVATWLPAPRARSIDSLVLLRKE